MLDFRRPATRPKYLNRRSQRSLWMLVMASGLALLLLREAGHPERWNGLMQGASRLTGASPADDIDTRWSAIHPPQEPTISMAAPLAGRGPGESIAAVAAQQQGSESPADAPADDAPYVPVDNDPPPDDAPDVPVDNDPPAEGSATESPPDVPLDNDGPADVTPDVPLDNGPPADTPPAESEAAPTTPPTDRPAAEDPAAKLDDATLLSKVQDDTYFRPEDSEIWYRLLARLRDGSPAELARESSGQVTFAQLFRQPSAYRGRVIDLVGTVRQAIEKDAPANRQGIKSYYQLSLQPEDNPASPIVIYCLTLPPEFPVGAKINVPVRLTGIFFKRWVYQAGDTIRLAPLVLAATVDWQPNPLAGDTKMVAKPIPYWLIGATIAASLLFVAVLWTWGRRGTKYEELLLAEQYGKIEIGPPPEVEVSADEASELSPADAERTTSTDAQGWPDVN